MSDIWKIRLVGALFISAGILGLIFDDAIGGSAPLSVLFVKLLGPTGAIWLFRLGALALIILPIAIYWLHTRSERRVNAYFRRQSMLEPETDHRTGHQQ